MSEFVWPPPRTVHPRKSKYKHYPFIIVKGKQVWRERTDTICHLDELYPLLKTEPCSLIVSEDMGAIVDSATRHYANDPLWNAQIIPKEDSTTDKAYVTMFGWRRPRKDEYGKHESKYHHCLDPIVFSGKNIPNTVTKSIESLYNWAKEVRDFAKENDMQVKASSGGLASQFLRDARFYPNPRRKIPKWINEVAREHLPANHYRQYVSAGKVISNALSVDASGAHHYAASNISLPDPNSLYARGYYNATREQLVWIKDYYAKRGGKIWNIVTKMHGLFCVDVSIARVPKFPLPQMEESTGRKIVYLWSNELEQFENDGGYIHGIYACWTSHLTEQDAGHGGMKAFAMWALSQPRTQTLKPLMLMPYGLLACRPRILKIGWLRGVKGKGRKRQFTVGTRSLSGREYERPIGEPGFVNVIHRGMIEAETRRQSLLMARELDNHNVEVLSIAADAVVVRDGSNLPLLPKPWRIKTPLTGLRYLANGGTHWIATESECLPGITADMKERYLRTRKARQILAA